MAQITLNSTGVASNGTLALQTNGTTPALTIDASQNVGIGTGSPSSLFTVNGESNISQVVFKQNVSAYTTGLSNPVIARASGFTGVYASGSLLLQARSDAAADIALITGTTPEERMRITSAGNVGIGTSLPASALSVVKGAAGDEVARFQNSANFGIRIIPQIGGSGSVTAIRTGSGESITLDTSNTERMRITSDGYLRMASGSGGIQFGGDTAAANALDDYEEGTWTPTYVPTTGAFTSVTYDAQTSGRYTKIGNVVYLQGTLRTDAITVGTAAGDVKVGGLPFTSISSTPNASVTVGYSAAFGGDEPNGGIAISNTSTIGLYYKATSNGDSVALDVTDLATGANTNYVIFQIFYTV
jgi:hypothetical protein